MICPLIFSVLWLSFAARLEARMARSSSRCSQDYPGLPYLYIMIRTPRQDAVGVCVCVCVSHPGSKGFHLFYLSTTTETFYQRQGDTAPDCRPCLTKLCNLVGYPAWPAGRTCSFFTSCNPTFPRFDSWFFMILPINLSTFSRSRLVQRLATAHLSKHCSTIRFLRTYAPFRSLTFLPIVTTEYN